MKFIKYIKAIINNARFLFCCHGDYKWIRFDSDMGRNYHFLKICNKCGRLIKKIDTYPNEIAEVKMKYPWMLDECAIIDTTENENMVNAIEHLRRQKILDEFIDKKLRRT